MASYRHAEVEGSGFPLMPQLLKRWLFLFAGTIACMAILSAFRFSHLSFLAVFLIIVIAAALHHGD
jgi:hypothetical protein